MNEQVPFATMSDREKYLFDLQGFLVIAGFLTPGAVAALNTAIDNVIVQTCESGNGLRNLDPLVERGDPPRIGATTGTPRNSDAIAGDLVPRLQIIERADAVPRLDTG